MKLSSVTFGSFSANVFPRIDLFDFTTADSEVLADSRSLSIMNILILSSRDSF